MRVPPIDRDEAPIVHSISAAPASAKVDMSRRVRIYLLSMGIRTASFALAFIFGFVLEITWAAWVFIVLAVILPYPAVVIANNRDRHVATHTVESPIQALTARPSIDPLTGRGAPPAAPLVITADGALITPPDTGPTRG